MLLLAVVWSPARAGLPETIVRIKPSVVAVCTFQRTRSPQFRLLGTGFAVGDGSRIATNSHVVPAVLNAEEMEELVVIVVGSDGEKARKARKIGSDPEHDLALLKIEGEPLPALGFGNVERVREGDAVAFTGFPILGALGLHHATHRATVASITPIVIPQAGSRQLNAQAVKRIREGTFSVFQLDGTAYPGNSGSPVFDPDSGEVLAIVNMVWVKGSKESALTDPSGVTYAIPATFLRRLVEGARAN